MEGAGERERERESSFFGSFRNLEAAVGGGVGNRLFHYFDVEPGRNNSVGSEFSR